MPGPRSTTILLGRFEDLVSRGLQALVDEDPSLELVAADVAHDALDRRLGALEPLVALLNFGSLRSPVDIQHLHQAHPGTRLVVFANRPSQAEATQVLSFGATTCLSKDTQSRDVLTAIHLASRGLRMLPNEAAGPGAFLPDGPELLTPREGDVLERLREGQSNAQIAATLHLGVETVRTHRRNIYRKLGVRTRRELVPGAARSRAS